MALPTQTELELPLLRLLESRGGEAKPRDLYEPLAHEFPQVTSGDLSERMESTGGLKWENHVQWVRQRLVQKGEIDGSVRGVWRISPAGRARLSAPSQAQKERESRPGPGAAEPRQESNRTPREIIEASHRELRDALAAELLQTVRKCSPTFFERLVVDLLVKIGYGGTRSDAGRALGQVGDDGIDGIIKEDRLGLGVIYLQAKRWTDTVVGRPEIQKFAGALQGHRAQKGVFITTSSFSKDAREYVERIESKIVLIDGAELASLMIDFGVGVTEVASFAVKRIDSDYFAEE